jgi:hypothetical protein
MRAAYVWCVMAGLFVAANVVAAGTMLVLGRALEMLLPYEDATVWIMYAAGAAGALAAVCFLRGAMAGALPGRKFYDRS